ncbi:MAG: RecQ family ATP-dependent DNA helicase, partial [Gammaproteobacteria bacterium]|nr:RecQ family ATP-dependent DNA helicase [Gammaproteobacteria bacterium]
MNTALDTLQHYYGYSEFRPQQAEIIGSVEQGQDTLVIMPTGGGKSLCYQIPSLLRPGVGLVISPLIALMHDQVTALQALGIKAAYLNSQLSAQESFNVIQQLRSGELQLLYIAPERLLMPDTLSLLQQTPLSLIAIDEAHCVSQWGHDFRPEYMKLHQLAQAFPNVPRIALTATADARTQDEIVHNLQLNNPARFVAGFDRPNIRYHISSGQSAKERMLAFLDEHHPNEAGIVYCLSRNAVEKTAFWLMEKGRKAIYYHAGMDANERREAQDRFLKEDGLIVVATIAFGMGIDKPDVRFVAHLNLPKSVEAYYQETGRAGRDGAPANAWMNYDLSDVVKLAQWIEQSEAADIQKRVERHK